MNMEDASLIALVENLQRRDLDFIEEANGINQLIRMFGMSQEEAARRIGKSQSAVANKLRLLKLPQDVLDALMENGLSERHGRALLRLPEPEQQREALMYIVDNGLNVAAADAYIDALLSRPAEETEQEKPEGRRTFILKDVRGLPQHPVPEHRPDEAGGHRRRGPPGGDGGLPHPHYLHPQGKGAALSPGANFPLIIQAFSFIYFHMRGEALCSAIFPTCATEK